MTQSNAPQASSASNTKPAVSGEAPRALDTEEMIERLATDMRIRSGGELPHSFCVEQVRRQLAGEKVEASAANDEAAQPGGKGSVFHAWALSE